jgi:heat shock protein HslJ
MKKIILLSICILSVFILHAEKKKKYADNLPLLNTKWILTEIYETKIVSQSDTAYIIFSDSYKFSGNLGCNLFFGEFNYGKKKNKMDYFGATKKMCADMEVEENFVKAIRNDILHYYIEKNKLYWLYKNKPISVFEGEPLSQ